MFQSTFFEYIFCNEKPNVESNALIRPVILNEISVIVAMITPTTTGISER